MSKRSTLEDPSFSKFTFFCALIYLPIAIALGDVLFICLVYGSNAYFIKGLRIIKHNPVTLSTGTRIGSVEDFLSWAITVVIWLVLSCGGGAVLAKLYALCRVAKKASHSGQSDITVNLTKSADKMLYSSKEDIVHFSEIRDHKVLRLYVLNKAGDFTKIVELQSGVQRNLDKTTLFILEVENNNKVDHLISILPPGCASATSIIGKAESAGNPLQPDDFTPNPTFVSLLHRCIEKFGPSSPSLLKEAAKQMHGVLYVIDARTPIPSKCVLPEDIIGAFEIHAGQVESKTYRPNLNYKLLTARGFFVLDDFIERHLLAEVRRK